MSLWLKQSTAVTVPMGPFVDDTDFKTVETALSLTQAETRLSKNGGAFAQKNDATTASHMEEGTYGIVLNATDTDTLGALRIQILVTGALSVWAEFQVVPANVWDALFGADKLQVDAVEFGSVAGTFSAGRPEVNTTHWRGTQPNTLTNGRVDAVELMQRSSTVAASDASTVTLDGGASGTDDFYNDMVIHIVSGTGAGQTRRISDYVGATKVATVTPNWITNPGVGATFLIQSAHGRSDVGLFKGAVPNDLQTGRVDASVGAMAADVITASAVAAAALNGKGDWNIGKTGYALSAAGIQAIWDALTSALVTAGSIGKLLVDNINATIASRSSHAAADIWSVATRLLTAGTNIVLAKGTGVTGFNDLSAAQVNAEVDAALDTVLPVTPTAGSLNDKVKTNLDAAVSSRATPAQVNAEVVDALTVDIVADSIPADGSRPTIAQAAYMLTQFMLERSVSGTTVTVKKPDGTTTLFTLTLNDGASPTSITRAT